MIPRNPRAAQAARLIRRASRRYPSLVLGLRAPYVAFRRGESYEVFMLERGEARLMSYSLQGWDAYEVFAHVRRVARAYAEALRARHAS